MKVCAIELSYSHFLKIETNNFSTEYVVVSTRVVIA